MRSPPPSSARPELERWLRQQKITDPHTRHSILALHEQWAQTPRHTLYKTDNPKADEADLVLISEIDAESQSPRYRVMGISKRDAQFHVATVKREATKDYTPLQIGWRAINNYGFEYGARSFESGQDRSWFKHDVLYLPAHGHARKLVREIARLAGKPDVPDWYDNRNKRIYGRLHDALAREEARRIRKVCHGFIAEMDQAALKVMRHIGTVERWTYQWLTGERDWIEDHVSQKKKAASPQAQQRRQQAATAFPGLIFMMRNSREISKAIDADNPFMPAVMDHLSGTRWRKHEYAVSPALMKFIVGKKPRAFDPKYKRCLEFGSNEKFAMEVHNIFGFISQLPKEWWPNKPEQWKQYQGVKHTFESWSHLTGLKPKELVRGFAQMVRTIGSEHPAVFANQQGAIALADVKRVLGQSEKPYRMRQIVRKTLPDGKITPDFIAAIGSRAHDDSFGGLEGNLKDFISRVVDQVVVPAIAQTCADAGINWVQFMGQFNEWSSDNGHAIGTTASQLFNGISPSVVYTASKRWHRQAAGMERLTGRYQEPSSWLRLFNPTISPEGVRMRCLNSSTALLDEGSEQSNCVGGYAYNCMFKGSHIISLTAADKSWRTTMELQVKDREVQCVQHELAGNGRNLPPEALAAQNWLVGAINKGLVPVDWKAVDAAQAANLQRMQEFEEKKLQLRIGFNPLNRDDTENAYQRWRRAIPDILPDATRTEMLERTGITQHIKAEIAERRQQPYAP